MMSHHLAWTSWYNRILMVMVHVQINVKIPLVLTSGKKTVDTVFVLRRLVEKSNSCIFLCYLILKRLSIWSQEKLFVLLLGERLS